MEDVFEHKATEEELRKLQIKGNKESYDKNTDEFTRLIDLYNLYALRNNKEKSLFFFREAVETEFLELR